MVIMTNYVCMYVLDLILEFQIETFGWCVPSEIQ